MGILFLVMFIFFSAGMYKLAKYTTVIRTLEPEEIQLMIKYMPVHRRLKKITAFMVWFTVFCIAESMAEKLQSKGIYPKSK